jgi:hypothetical protein
VKGIAEPSLIKLLPSQSPFAVLCQTDIPLHVTHRAVLSKDKIAPQRIDNHEDHLVKWRMVFLLAAILFPIRKTRQDRLVWKESSREDQDRNWEQEVGECEASLAEAMRKRHGIVQLGARAKVSSQRTMSSVLVASEVRQVHQGVDFTSAGWRESRERRRRSAGKFNQVRSPFLRRFECSCQQYRYFNRTCCQRGLPLRRLKGDSHR